jgi:hypothetical protein
MRFESSLGAVGLAVAAVAAISQTSLAQTAIDETVETGATAKFIAIGTPASTSQQFSSHQKGSNRLRRRTCYLSIGW